MTTTTTTSTTTKMVKNIFGMMVPAFGEKNPSSFCFPKYRKTPSFAQQVVDAAKEFGIDLVDTFFEAYGPFVNRGGLVEAKTANGLYLYFYFRKNTKSIARESWQHPALRKPGFSIKFVHRDYLDVVALDARDIAKAIADEIARVEAN